MQFNVKISTNWLSMMLVDCTPAANNSHNKYCYHHRSIYTQPLL